MADHIHRWIDSDGVTEIRISAVDFDRLWLARQRLTTGPVVFYAGYTPISRSDIPQASDIPPTGGVRYGGYMFEDTSDCPICSAAQ